MFQLPADSMVSYGTHAFHDRSLDPNGLDDESVLHFLASRCPGDPQAPRTVMGIDVRIYALGAWGLAQACRNRQRWMPNIAKLAAELPHPSTVRLRRRRPS